jgi:hypothetical protein
MYLKETHGRHGTMYLAQLKKMFLNSKIRPFNEKTGYKNETSYKCFFANASRK